ncbi:hypothetical protein JW835_03895 [bacterium]|nr:hypothetical protein [bacterium]RQV97938.1 MAG: hypothetical protein EH221_02995 [bacterium]
MNTTRRINGILILWIVLYVCFGCQKNPVFNDFDDIVGEWILEKLTWTQNNIEISVSPEMKGYRQNIDFKSNSLYIKNTFYIWSDTTIVETGIWSIKKHTFTLKPENGDTETGDYELHYKTLSIAMIKEMIIDESGIAKKIPVTMTYKKL